MFEEGRYDSGFNFKTAGKLHIINSALTINRKLGPALLSQLPPSTRAAITARRVRQKYIHMKT